MNSEKILESFVEENCVIAERILCKLEKIDSLAPEKVLSQILGDMKIIKSNALVMDFVLLERVCNGFEEILVAILTKNLIFNSWINTFLIELVKQILKHIDDIKNNRNEQFKSMEKWIVDCDRIAAGVILEVDAPQKSEYETENQENHNILLSGKVLNEMLRSFEDISMQKARLKLESKEMEKYDAVLGVEYSRLRKNVVSTINNLENLLQTVQEQLLELDMTDINETLKDFQFANSNKECKVEIEESNLMMDRNIAPHLSKILNLFFKNSNEYGFENVSAPCVHVSARKNGNLLEVTFKDNGNGIDLEEFRTNIIQTFPQRAKEVMEMDQDALGIFLFTEGMTPAQNGLHAAWKEIEQIKGKLKIHTEVGKGTSFVVSFPKTLSSESGFTIRYGSAKFFIPSNYVQESVSKSSSELVTDCSKPYFEHRGQKIKIYRLSSVMSGFTAEPSYVKQDDIRILIIEYLELKFGLVVDDVIGFSSKVIKPVPNQLKEIQEVEGIVIDESYDVIPVLNVPSLIKRFTWLRDYDLKRTEVAARKIVRNALVVDSSAFARHVIRSIYENNGYYVDEAGDGIEALDIIKKKKINLLISAVEMPRMNGLTLLENVRRNEESRDIPVILFPFDADEEEEKSYLKMGANFVIKKNDFDRNKLLKATDGIDE